MSDTRPENRSGAGAKFASLGPLLLARKGTAKPAMRVQLEGQSRGTVADMDAREMAADEHLLNDLGWNDMGEDHDPAEEARPEVLRQQTRLVHSIADANLAAMRAAERDEAQASRRAAFTLRLDDERHLRLRLACTIESESAQTLVTRALDRFLAEVPGLDHLATQVRTRSGRSPGKKA